MYDIYQEKKRVLTVSTIYDRLTARDTENIMIGDPMCKMDMESHLSVSVYETNRFLIHYTEIAL